MQQVGARYVVLPKDLPSSLADTPVSTTSILAAVRAPTSLPLRVDFAGGWLDVPHHARPGCYIVNCAISPLVTLTHWPYRLSGGLGGSGAHALLCGRDGVAAELELGVGWQDPAVVKETGLCVWHSGQRPALDFKTDGAWLAGRLALLWTGSPHVTPQHTNVPRDYDAIAAAGAAARAAVIPGSESFHGLAVAVAASHDAQARGRVCVLPMVTNWLLLPLLSADIVFQLVNPTGFTSSVLPPFLALSFSAGG
jgi:hypothetical protein